ncbi:hypothetical protein [Pseudonocardia alni]|uniref:phage terminase small subunit n=1 Tax=Pseudonocardia alni TaxID=33907 RepID=UPI001AD70642|nr:hypothetical protein [Pseudonocardia alni]MBO4241463.1 hypothetical protein [Pseudonocardia alni]
MRHGHRSKAEKAYDEVTPMPVEWPEVPERWHYAARDWYLSLQWSAQVVDYQQSDVALAVILAEDLSRHLAYERRPSAATPWRRSSPGAGSCWPLRGSADACAWSWPDPSR